MDADVLIVGAGLAGLCATRALRRGGLQAHCLEARDRVGGRTHSLPTGPGMHDMGGQWLGPGQVRAYALARELGIRTFPTHHEGRKIVDLGGRRATYTGSIPRVSPWSLLELELCIRATRWLARDLDPADPMAHPRAARWDATTVESFSRRILRTRASRELLAIALRAVFGAEARELSLLFFLSYCKAGGSILQLIEVEGGAQQDRLAGGAQGLSLGLAEQLGEAVHLGCPVERIAQDRAGVQLEAGGQRWRARRAILAIPPTLTARITFDPPLSPTRRQLGQRLPMGRAIKMFALYERPFWREEGLSGEAVSDSGPAGFFVDDSPADASHGALLGFVAGDGARRWGACSARDRHQAFRAQLGRVFGARAAEPELLAECDWGAEPWSGGGPVALGPPGALSAGLHALREPQGRIHWAGTETATEWTGYMEGALQSGERSAAEVLAVESPRTLAPGHASLDS